MKIDKKITKDIRDIAIEDFDGVDGIIHLAGLSNDPLGEFLQCQKEDINYNGTMNLAMKARVD